jgi:hypothetical protein
LAALQRQQLKQPDHHAHWYRNPAKKANSEHQGSPIETERFSRVTGVDDILVSKHSAVVGYYRTLPIYTLAL